MYIVENAWACAGIILFVLYMHACDIVLRDVSHTAVFNLSRIRRIDRSGKPRLALHAPKLIMSLHVST